MSMVYQIKECCFRPRFCTVRLYRAGDNLGQWDKFVMNHAPGAGSIAQPVLVYHMCYRSIYMLIKSLKGWTTSHINTQLYLFAFQLTIYHRMSLLLRIHINLIIKILLMIYIIHKIFCRIILKVNTGYIDSLDILTCVFRVESSY